ncbi:MAG: hypothetical protein GXO19_03955 [Epsilonproteobacteria bacterium]|nr:hypothetical protein [Campylobacterota bacterium]NPA56875.1 hypothetical protein [Campylobacterota bacterium]
MKFTICLLNGRGELPPSTKEALKSDLVGEVMSRSPVEGVESQIVGEGERNTARVANEMVERASHDYLIWLHDGVGIDGELLEEYRELLEEGEVDLIYPNLIIGGRSKNFSDWSDKKIELLQSFRLEEEIPPTAFCTKKRAFTDFDESMEEYTFYNFLYRNIKRVSLRLSDLSFAELPELPTPMDLSFNSKTLRSILPLYNFQEELFYHLDWKREEVAYATAYTLVGNRLMEYHDYYNASLFYKKALLFFHNQESLKNLLYSYYQMGLFSEMVKMVDREPVQEELKERFTEKLFHTESLLKWLEPRVQGEKAEELDDRLIRDILDTYDGAPIHNLIAAYYIYRGELEKGYLHLFQAAMRNPIDRQILENIAPLAQHLQRTHEVSGLYDRLLH